MSRGIVKQLEARICEYAPGKRALCVCQHEWLASTLMLVNAAGTDTSTIRSAGESSLLMPFAVWAVWEVVAIGG